MILISKNSFIFFVLTIALIKGLFINLFSLLVICDILIKSLKEPHKCKFFYKSNNLIYIFKFIFNSS